MEIKINEKKFKIFLEVVGALNSRFKIIPILYGSLGLCRQIGDFKKANDIDILIPNIFLNKKWNELVKFMQGLGFRLNNEIEHDFIRKKGIVAFGKQNDLKKMCRITLDSLKTSIVGKAKFKELSPKQYLTIYKFMLRDNYRQEKLGKNDKEKINLIEEYLKKSSLA